MLRPEPSRAEVHDIGVFAVLRELLLDRGGAEAELGAGRAEDRNVDRPRVVVDPLVDPAQPAIQARVHELPSLVAVLRQKADGRTERERHGDRRAQNAKKSQSGHPSPGGLGPRRRRLGPGSNGGRRARGASARIVHR